ncbi:DNA-binding response OmpR family regulator [Lachnospiraceae bacterium PM6-15]|uniref:Stage 0 sporulation protein A homolog n=3 Tax=Ohessyouella blattaphilus TaxID=2949333 RepID=A0ABT1ELB8_9FIRM|nr:response regulator transcription factor [Ohessyouella blattaphilus]MCP1111478.1 response regulator transcription factor [Ohessyouella blattaphilus]MCR8564872.1 response regulator transcription factor [Ohessyouella blattaphilus]
MRERRLTEDMSRRRVAFIGQDALLFEGIKQGLESQGAEVKRRGTAAEAIISSVKEKYDVIVIDDGAIEDDGIWLIEMLREIRETFKFVLILNSKDKRTELAAIDKDVDVVLTKHKSIKVIIHYIERLFEELDEEKQDLRKIYLNGVYLDKASNFLHIEGKSYKVTSKEFHVAWLMIEHAGKALSREFIYEQLWGNEGDLRAVDSCIKHLRKKIGTQYIATIRGYGYSWVNIDD